ARRIRATKIISPDPVNPHNFTADSLFTEEHRAMKSTTTNHRGHHFSLEPLDARRLLSVSTAGSQVIVLGTPDADHVLVQVSPSDPARLSVNLNGEQSTYIINDTTGILIDTGSGRDQV